MNKAILAKKIGMTQVFDEAGLLVPVTVLEAGPCVVIQKKTVENDGYQSVVVGFGEVKIRRINKPDKGRFDKAGVTVRKYIRELRLESTDGMEIGNELKADLFAAGDKVDVSGTSKGKGFQGAIRRHNQHRGPMSHGSKYHRGLGSMGSGTSPGKVRKGKGMAGHMGHVKVTVQNLEIVRADGEQNLLLIKGPVPGPRGALVLIKNSVKA